MNFKLILIILIIIPIFSNAQCNADLKKYSTEFESINSNSFKFFDDVLEDIKIVGIGEKTHGTSQFTILPFELMKYLNQEHNFKILILETGFSEGAYLNDYIQGKRDDLNYIVSEINSTWRYKTKSFIKYMQEIRAFNEINDNKIVLYGCEMQWAKKDVDRIKDYLKKVKSSYEIDGFEKHLWQEITLAEKSDYYISYHKLRQYFNDNERPFISMTSKSEFDLINHCIDILGQFSTAINQNVEQRKHDFREIYMLENIEWILEYEGVNSKALYWAHNGHVGNMTVNNTANSTGSLLKNVFAEKYYSIATDFGSGQFRAFSADWKMKINDLPPIEPHSFTACIKNLSSNNLFINIRLAKNDDELIPFFKNPVIIMSGAGAQVSPKPTTTMNISKEFDGIIFLQKSSAIIWME